MESELDKALTAIIKHYITPEERRQMVNDFAVKGQTKLPAKLRDAFKQKLLEEKSNDNVMFFAYNIKKLPKKHTDEDRKNQYIRFIRTKDLYYPCLESQMHMKITDFKYVQEFDNEKYENFLGENIRKTLTDKNVPDYQKAIDINNNK